MNEARRKKELAESLTQLAATYAETVRQFEATLATVRRVLASEYAVSNNSKSALPVRETAPASLMRPHTDRATFSVVFKEKSCFLGNSLLFRFAEALLRRPNRFIAYSELLEEVWGGPRAESSIRNVAKRLRDRLIVSGMADVAKAIESCTPGHFVMRFPFSE